MKLYEFEKYYLRLTLYHVHTFFARIWKNKLGRYLLIGSWFFVAYAFAMIVIVYFLIGANVFLEKVHLEKYRVDKFTFMHSEFDLRPYYKK